MNEKLLAWDIVHRDDLVSLISVLRVNPALMDLLDDHDWSLLHWSVAHDSRRVVDYLLDAGADPNLCNASGETSLHLATSSETAVSLLSKGALLTCYDRMGKTPVDHAVYAADPELLRTLIAHHNATG